MSHSYDIRTAAKLHAIINIFEKSDLVNREFTKKEFDKVFKGLSSLDWLRKDRSYYPQYRIIAPCVKVTRVEIFEMPYRNKNSNDKETVKNTFTAHRNFYTVDLEALKSIATSCEVSDEMKKYYVEKLNKARKYVTSLEKIVTALGIII